MGAGSRPKYWSCKYAEQLARSLQHAVQCLESGGIPWVESLHDPKVFAANIDPVAALPAGMAHEVIGAFSGARGFYGEMMRRLLSIFQHSGESETFRRYAKAFIYAAVKLDVECERRKRLQRALEYYPTIDPLPSGH